MSRLSGKCDLYDHLSMMKHRTKEGSDDPKDLKEAKVLYSDIMECFEIFKARTGGVIYQHHKIDKVDQFNRDLVAKYCGCFKILRHEEEYETKQGKKKTHEVVEYEYYGKKYSEKEINKKGVWIEIPIKFDNLLELMPYLSYIVAVACCNDGVEHIVISKESYPDEQFDSFLQHGFEDAVEYYYDHRKALAELYKEVVNDYMNPVGREVVEEVEFDENGEGHPSNPVDYNFDPRFADLDSHGGHCWSHPKIKDENTLTISEFDYKSGHKRLIKYIKKVPYKLNLD